MPFELQLKKRWQGFLKRSPEYKLSFLYGIVGLFFFCFGFYCMATMASTYKYVEDSFMVETPEQFRAVGFFSTFNLFCGMMASIAIFSWIGMIIFTQLDYSKRLKKIEDFQDSVFDFSKDEG